MPSRKKKAVTPTVELFPPPQSIVLHLVFDEDEITSIELNHHKKGYDLNDPEVQAYLGKVIAETLVEKELYWRKYKALVQHYCNCFAKNKKGKLIKNYHSSNCASWEADIASLLEEVEV